MTEQRTVLVTGASGGLGGQVVDLLTAAGWAVVAVGRNDARLRERLGDAVPRVQADVSTLDGARLAVTGAREVLGSPPQALAHCVGNVVLAPLMRTSEAQYRSALSANLDSAFFTLQAWVSALREVNQPGAAVLVSSTVARIGTPNHEAVAAAKAGLEGLVRAAAATHAPFGMRINAVAPAIMDTPAVSGVIGTPAARDAAGRQYPIPGIGDARDTAELMIWLLSPAAKRVTGQTWAIDGGFSAVRPLVR